MHYQGFVVVPAQFYQRIMAPVVGKLPEIPPREGVPQRTYTIRNIVIDPGHGAHDPGAIKGTGGVKEKDINLDIGLRLASILRDHNIDVTMTRQTDVFIPLIGRTRIANERGADLFVSIHSNAGLRSYSGFEVYYLSEAVDENTRALEAAENAPLTFDEASFAEHSTALDAILWDLIYTENRQESIELAKDIKKAMGRRLPSRDLGVKSARFVVLKYTRMPAVLIEVGFLTNPVERARLKNKYYRQMVAEAIADGMLAYKETFERTNGFTK
jgi:N-acetylmuramoyl-L-alanine amidase